MRASSSPRLVASVLAVACVVGGCQQRSPRDAPPSAGPAPAGAAPTAAPPSGQRALAATSRQATGAHAAHGAFACEACHACPGVVQLTPVSFPGGTTSEGGTITRGDPTTCAVGCHAPLGAPPQVVAWNAGPLRCTDCHANVATQVGTVRSSHVGGSPITAATCASCHDHSRHTRGEVRLVNGDGTSAAGSCEGCHAGAGQTLAGATPPVLVGWRDGVGGDFHGAREGTCRFDRLDSSGQIAGSVAGRACPTGQPAPPNALRITSRWWYVSGTSGPWSWTCDIETVDAGGQRIGTPLLRRPCPEGTTLNSTCNNPVTNAGCYPTTLVTRGAGGTLRPPYARGQGALACSACHDFHSSANAFLLAATVNGAAIPAGRIDRAGVGAQALCNACHAGERHQVCKSCHREIWTSDGEYAWFEGEPVDPSPDGSACFYCHGHEGIRKMVLPTPSYPANHPFHVAGQDRDQSACSHCHDAWRPPPTEYVAPRFWPAAPAVSGVTATTATVTWRTDEAATTWVEYGVGTAGHVKGSAELVADHAVTLTGLTPGTAYVWRVRSSDAFRNVTVSALRSFTTPGAQAVPRPDLAPVSTSIQAGTHTATVALPWYPVTAPSGTPVQYEVQLASDPAFTGLAHGALPGPGIAGSSIGDSGWIAGTPTTIGGRPALSVPATLTDIPQDDCTEVVPRMYYWRVRARDQQGNVSEWSQPGELGAFAGDPWC